MTTAERTRKYSGFLLSFEPKRTEKIKSELSSVAEAVESFSALDWKFERREIVFLALKYGETSIGCVALLEHMSGGGGTGKRKMRLTKPLFITPAIQADELTNVIFLSDWISTAEQIKRIEPATWIELAEAVKRLRPTIKEPFKRLVAARDKETRLLG